MSRPHRQRASVIDGRRLVVVQDVPQVCPYLPGHTARMPLQLPLGQVDPDFTDWVLAFGYRRSGDFVYRTQCRTCHACQPTRLAVDEFRWSKSFRRVLNRADRDLSVRWSDAIVSQNRVDLFNKHRAVRGLDTSDTSVDQEGYHAFLVTSFGRVDEMTIWDDDRLIGVAIADVGRDCLSAVYTMFDPDYSRYSLGSYAILKEIQRAQRERLRYVYLGMYVRDNSHLNYKARFVPQQRWIDGHWQDVPRSVVASRVSSTPA